MRHSFNRSLNTTLTNLRRSIHAMSNPQTTNQAAEQPNNQAADSKQPADDKKTAAEQYSGEAHLKMPKSLHRKLAEAAEQEGVDLNQYLVTLLTEQSVIGSVQSKLDDLNRQLARRESMAYSRERTTPYNRYVEDIEMGIND